MSAYRRPAVDVETQLMVIDGNAVAVLRELAREGWRVVGCEGSAWRLERTVRGE